MLNTDASELFALVEAGGTKFICAVADENGQIQSQTRIQTTTSERTLGEVVAFFRAQTLALGGLSAIAVGSFGPVDNDPSSHHYGYVLSTPKPGWSDTNLLGHLTSELNLPGVIDTDVNAAALGEYKFGAARECRSVCYVTVGTGVGVGLCIDGSCFPRSTHSEVGHIRVPRAHGDSFEGICPYHQDCLEGLACGPALNARWGQPAETLPQNHPAWNIEAHYLACLCQNLVYTVRPDRIVLGGGVFNNGWLIDRVRAKLAESLAGYALRDTEQDMSLFLRSPGCLDAPPAILGTLEMAKALGKTAVVD
ncbi:MAG: ROK family protein [Pseudomonadota bacterium]